MIDNKSRSVFLAYGYSQKNAGDMAICIGALDVLIFDAQLKVTLLSRYHDKSIQYIESKEYFQNRYGKAIKILPSPFYLEREKNFLFQSLNYLKSIFNYVFWQCQKDILDGIRKSDLVIFNGGNLLRCSSIQDYIRLIALDFPLKIARKLKVRYIIFPQSSAHINKKGDRIIYKMLVNADKVFLREELSYNKLKTKYNLSNLVRLMDLAFFINKNKKLHQNSNEIAISTHKTIAFTFRAHTVGDLYEMNTAQKNLIQNRIELIIHRFKPSCKFLFVVQTIKDKKFTLELKKYFENKFWLGIDLFESYDPIKLIDMYEKTDVLVGMRLHSIILAASIGVPSYGIFFEQWGLKNPGLMKDLDLPYYMIDKQESINLEEIDYLLNNKEHFKDIVKQIILNESMKIKEALKAL